MTKVALFSTLGILAFSSVAALAQPASHRVFVDPVIKKTDGWTVNSQVVIEGQIQRLDAEMLLVVQEDGKPFEASSDRVARVEIAWANSQAEEAHRLVEQREYKAAVTALQEAIKSGIPRWQQRFLISDLIQCADAMGNPRTAGILFLNLAASAPPPMLYENMPLCWTVREGDRVILDTAAQWLQNDDPHAQLLGASWQLFGSKDAEARKVLQKLQANDNQVIAKLAVAQSWRLTGPPDTLNRLPQWVQFRSSLLQPLQLGPTEFLADRLMRVGEVDLAIGHLMRIATVHGERYHRAARAVQTAASLLEREGHKEEAQRLEPWIERFSQP